MEQQFWVGIHGVIANRGRLLVLRRAGRMPYKPGSWDLPGGHLALGESVEQCLVREVKEETNLDVSLERLLGINTMVGEPYVQAIYSCSLQIYQQVRLRPDEHIESKWATLEELAALELIPYLESILKRGLLARVRGLES